MGEDRRVFEEAVLERICVTCPEYAEGGGCHLSPLFRCGVKEALPEVLNPEFETCGASVAGYIERLTTEPRPDVSRTELPEDKEARAEHLKRYYQSLILEAIEEVRARRDAAELASAP